MVLEVETCCLQAFTDLVVKLSETSFRPFFLKVKDIVVAPYRVQGKALSLRPFLSCYLNSTAANCMVQGKGLVLVGGSNSNFILVCEPLWLSAPLASQ